MSLMALLGVVVVALLLFSSPVAALWMGGVAKVNCVMPDGVPLAGINHGERRVKDWPLPKPTKYTTWMTPSAGVRPEGMWCRALTLRETVTNVSVTFATIDAIGADGTMRRNAVKFARGQGYTVPVENVVLSASHSHSGPGALSSEFLWSVAPATDLMVPEVAEAYANALASALVLSEQNMRPVLVDANSFNLTGVSKNRRCRISPYVNCTTIDPNLGLLRVDDAATKAPMAVLWNYAMHGTCFGASNLMQSGDIMGMTNAWIESQMTSTETISMFQNADAGDVDPDYSLLCNGADPTQWQGPRILGQAVMAAAQQLAPTATGALAAKSNVVNFGPTFTLLQILNATLGRFDNCTHGGPLDICAVCRVLDCHVNGNLQSNWIENSPQFTAVRMDVNGRAVVFVTVPGEALVELGFQIRNDTKALGFDQTFFTGYSQNHLGYFAPPDEYDVGGYESQLTLWGIQTTARVRAGVASVATAVAPSRHRHRRIVK